MIKKFFEQLAGYYRMENDLSNVVVALSNSDKKFNELFVKYFFPDIDIDKISFMSREVPDTNNLGSRVDIYIGLLDDDKPYIIEVKIGDRNHHFGQYEEAYGIPRSRFGYITNYNCIEGKELGYDVKTWESFYDYITETASTDDLIIAFAAYLKNVCEITKYDKPMNLMGLQSIPCFVDTVKKIILADREGVKTPFHREYAYSTCIHEGFFINVPGKEENGFAVFGLWFQEKPVITIGVTGRPELSERIIGDKNVIPDMGISKFPYKEHFWEKNDIWFELSGDRMQALANAITYEAQKRILEEFFDEVIKIIIKHI